MAVATDFFNWQSSGLDPFVDPYEAPSPNIQLIHDHVIDTWGGASLGIHNNRGVRTSGGVILGQPSTHAFGAVFDWRWGFHPDVSASRWLTREQLEDEVIAWLIAYSRELGVQAIHDQGRIWRAYRSGDSNGGWKAYKTGYGAWIHVETNIRQFGDRTPITDRGIPLKVGAGGVVVPMPPPVGSTFNPTEGDYGLWPLRQPPFSTFPPNTGRTKNQVGDHVRYIQGVILHHAGGDIAVDGWFGEQTERRVTDMQRWFRHLGMNIAVDGWVGQQTWPIIHMLATIEQRPEGLAA